MSSLKLSPLLRNLSRSPPSAKAILPLSLVNIPDLRSHFPTLPVLPAVYLLDAFRELASHLQAHPLKLSEVRSARFRRIATPADRELTIAVHCISNHPPTFEATASLRNNGPIVAEARFVTEHVK